MEVSPALLLNKLAEMILLAIACHFLGDFPLQTKKMVQEKAKSWRANFDHAATYTSTFVIVFYLANFKLSIYSILLLLVSHFFIDAAKTRYNLISSIGDQLCHIAIIIFICCLELRLKY